jgi:hypothetical protein
VAPAQAEVVRLLPQQRAVRAAAARVLSSRRGLVLAQRVLRVKGLLAVKDIAAVPMLTFKLAAAVAARVQSVLTGSTLGVMAGLVLRLPSQERP